jgi:hypothetical protein
MAVHALPRSPARSTVTAGPLPAAVLMLALAPLAIDLFALVQPGAWVADAGVIVAIIAAGVLVATWLRFPRTSWLVAASVAALASLAMRLVGADVAPFLSLLSVVAVGIGGGFASPELGATLV